ncbi:hypothetical protein XM53_16135 [Roseovarius atlanticus]|uniref:Uncharacterized protein n=1 Tax=Roseovarius atlanticus TaxID=1641875 RepID=A0A0T5NRC9_9RHOB|nr:hypothetical protein [Roseovarius atlanticus]KRS11476.1 hypothetical protein XM53_16135 [Roseovarius atlanticus]
MTRFFTAIAAIVLAAPAWAAELNDDFEAIGTMSVTLDGETMELVIPYDVDGEEAYAQQKMIMGSTLSINAVGQTVGKDGTPGRPMVQVTLLEQGGEMRFLSAEVFDEQGFDAPLAMGADGGDGTLSAYEMSDDNVVTATVEGTFLRLTGYTGDPRVADGAAPVAATIRLEAELAPLE